MLTDRQKQTIKRIIAVECNYCGNPQNGIEIVDISNTPSNIVVDGGEILIDAIFKIPELRLSDTMTFILNPTDMRYAPRLYDPYEQED